MALCEISYGNTRWLLLFISPRDKMRLFSILIILSSLVMLSLASADEQPENFDTVTLERTPCFGMCPAYIVEIKSTGDFRFLGKSDVKIQGEQYGKLSMQDITFLHLAIKRANFHQLQDSYAKKSDGCTEVWTDNPSILIKIKSGVSTKTVKYYLGCRGPLLSKIAWLADTIDEVAATSK